MDDTQLTTLIAEFRQRAIDAVGEITPAPATPSVKHRSPASIIDHTLLKPTATPNQIVTLCAEAREHGFASVCVNPVNVKAASGELSESDVAVCTVVGFPLGANSSLVKAYETRQAIADGATEIDMVINIGAVKAGDVETAARDVFAVVRTARDHDALVKVIIEAAYLTDEEKVLACVAAQVAGADYVKTSTGFGPHGATIEDVALMRRAVGPAMGVKAAGGVRTLADAHAMIDAGATRLGASAGVSIAREAQGDAGAGGNAGGDY